MSALAQPQTQHAELSLYSPEAERAREYARSSRAESTVRGYRTDWRIFSEWCAERDLSPLPASPGTVAAYIADQAGKLKVATLQRRLTSISQTHKLRGLESPTGHEAVRSVLKGIRRTHGTAQEQKAPLLASDVREIVSKLPDTLIGKRDRALLLIGFAGAFRRSELVALDVADLEHTSEGLVIVLRRSKTDQEGRGRRIGVPALPHSTACPVRALQEWLDASGIAQGAIFRAVAKGGRLKDRLSGRAVAMIVKKLLPADRDKAKFAGHSLRAGFVTSAATGGANLKAIMRQTGHRSLAMVLRYTREASLFRSNALSSTGL